MVSKYKYDGALITVVNWEKYNPRTDSKRPSWLRLDNNFLSDFRIFELKPNQKLMWIALLSQISAMNNSKFRISFRFMKNLIQISEAKQNQAIEIFEKLGLIVCETRTNLPATYERTDETNETNETIEQRKKKKEKKETPVALAATTEPIDSEFAFLCRKTWECYCERFLDRHGFAPLRNARVNSQVKQFCKDVGIDAPHVIEFYVKHPDVYYMKNQHPLGLAVSNYHSLYTQWKAGRAVTSSDAKAYEKQDAFKTTLERIERGEI